MLNVQNEFRQPISIDFAPAGSVCEEFIRVVASDLRREISAETAVAR